MDPAILATTPPATLDAIMVLGLVAAACCFAAAIYVTVRKIRNASTDRRRTESVFAAERATEFASALDDYESARGETTSIDAPDLDAVLGAAAGYRVTIDDTSDGLRASAVSAVCKAAATARRLGSEPALAELDEAIAQYREIALLVSR